MTPLRERVAAAIWEAGIAPWAPWSRLCHEAASGETLAMGEIRSALRQADAAIAECEKGSAEGE